MNDIVDKRKHTHGDYRRTARTAQAIKSVLETGDMWKFDEGFSDLARESLHLIATKMARIVEGDWSEPDHWRDISGYAELVLREIKRMELDRLAAHGFTSCTVSESDPTRPHDECNHAILFPSQVASVS